MVIDIISNNPFEYEVVKEPYGTDDRFILFHKDIFEQVSIAGDQTPQQVADNNNAERNTNFCINCWWKATFSKLSSDIELYGDGITNICRFYKSLFFTCQAMHSISLEVLPDYLDLSSNSSIFQIIIGDPSAFRGEKTKLVDAVS